MMGIRYYFHLLDDNEILGDLLGVEVGELADVVAAAIEILREFRVQEAHRRNELSRWSLAVTDSFGNCVIVLPLFTTKADGLRAKRKEWPQLRDQ